MNMIALIPCRAGSQRLPGKNMRLLQGHPVLAYTIAAAQQSGVFARVYVCTDDQRAGGLAMDMRAIWVPRPDVSDAQPDIEWVRWALHVLPDRPDAFAILRPTSPFRTAQTIQRAFWQFELFGEQCHSLRAVEPATQTPFKMWYADAPDRPMVPVLPRTTPDGTPYHSRPTQVLPKIFIQTSSLEMAWVSTVERYGTISGECVCPFFCEALEGFSLDHPGDFEHAEALVATHGPGILPPLPLAPVSAVSGEDDGADSGGAVAIGNRL